MSYNQTALLELNTDFMEIVHVTREKFVFRAETLLCKEETLKWCFGGICSYTL